MSGPKTTWEDLSNLGWAKQKIYTTLQAQRGNTMEGLGDMALNNGFNEEWGWYSYNVIKGVPRSTGDSISTVESQEAVWSYDNTGNLQPFTTTVTETWTETSEASLSITNKASMTLGSNVTIPGVGGSSFEISISTESTKTENKKSEYSLSQTWPITVGPGETVRLERLKTTTTGQSIYLVDYGVSDNSLIATKGKRYNDHYYWAYRINYYLNNPKGTMSLSGRSTKINFSFKIVRTGGNNRSGGPEQLALPTTIIEIIDGKEETKEMAYHADPK